MTDSTTSRLHKIATFLINNRYGIVALFVAITIGMMFAMAQLRIETGFKKQLPLKHEYMQTFLQYEKEFGGANRVLVALVAREGDMFTPEFFKAFEAITDQVFFIPGVDRASVRSIFTPNVRFVEIVDLRPRRCLSGCGQTSSSQVKWAAWFPEIFPAPWCGPTFRKKTRRPGKNWITGMWLRNWKRSVPNSRVKILRFIS
jgi:hypothetical protein